MLSIDFCKILNDDGKMMAYLKERSLLKREKPCAHCSNRMMGIQKLNSSIYSLVFRCLARKSKISTRKRAPFLRNQSSLWKIYLGYIFVFADVLQQTISEILAVHRHAINDFTNFIRKECSSKFARNDNRLGGLDVHVQVKLFLYINICFRLIIVW